MGFPVTQKVRVFDIQISSNFQNFLNLSEFPLSTRLQVYRFVDMVEAEAVCGHCGVGGKLNKCSACMTVRYCSRACQTYHWKEHKVMCKEMAKTKKSEGQGEVVYVRPVANPFGSEVYMFNEKTKKVDHTSSKAKKIGGAGKSMKIKIQVTTII